MRCVSLPLLLKLIRLFCPAGSCFVSLAYKCIDEVKNFFSYQGGASVSSSGGREDNCPAALLFRIDDGAWSRCYSRGSGAAARYAALFSCTMPALDVVGHGGRVVGFADGVHAHTRGDVARHLYRGNA